MLVRMFDLSLRRVLGIILLPLIFVMSDSRITLK